MKPKAAAALPAAAIMTFSRPRRPSPRRVPANPATVAELLASRERMKNIIPATPLPPAVEVSRRMMRHTEFARELGISARIVRGQFKRGGLPGAIEHSAYILMIPVHLLRLAKGYGLRQVERMAKAGMI